MKLNCKTSEVKVINVNQEAVLHVHDISKMVIYCAGYFILKKCRCLAIVYFNIPIFFFYRAELEKHGYKMETS